MADLITDQQDPYTDVASYHIGMEVDNANIDIEQALHTFLTGPLNLPPEYVELLRVQAFLTDMDDLVDTFMQTTPSESVKLLGPVLVVQQLTHTVIIYAICNWIKK